MFVAAESHTVASRYVQLLHHLSVRNTESSRFFFPAGFVHCYRRRPGIRSIFKNHMALSVEVACFSEACSLQSSLIDNDFSAKRILSCNMRSKGKHVSQSCFSCQRTQDR